MLLQQWLWVFTLTVTLIVALTNSILSSDKNTQNHKFVSASSGTSFSKTHCTKTAFLKRWFRWCLPKYAVVSVVSDPCWESFCRVIWENGTGGMICDTRIGKRFMMKSKFVWVFMLNRRFFHGTLWNIVVMSRISMFRFGMYGEYNVNASLN